MEMPGKMPGDNARQERNGDPWEEQSGRAEANADENAQSGAAEKLQHEQISRVGVVACAGERVNEQGPHSDESKDNVGSKDREAEAVPRDQRTAAE